MTSDTNEFEIAITDALNGMRLDKILSDHPSIQSRSRAAKLCSQGLVTVDGKSLKASYKPETGDTIRVRMPVPQLDSELQPYDFPLQFLYEDADIVVVNKPAGLVVHPSLGHANDTLVNALLFHVKNLSMGFQENRPGIVHRLDKDTSGILVVAKNDAAHAFLAKQFREKTVHRIYHALVYGCPKEPSGTLRSRLKRHPSDRKRFASVPGSEGGHGKDGKLAITHYRRLGQSPSGISLLECRLETGRTHQIRVHLSELGHPIVGDPIYGGINRAKNLKSLGLRAMISSMERIALHARELAFVHPSSGKLLSYSVNWPDDMKGLLSEIGLDHV
ncbi:MAG: RluA family pseudouridine synthase [Bdellovibrionales bacterium]|nr:RluA family pseudouridine synthase [Bdellovibrionales bacterium]